MAVGKYDFTVEQGTTFLTVFTWKAVQGACNDLLDKPKTPVDLTGMVLRMQVRPSAGSSTLYFEATSANGYLPIVTPTEGVFSLSLPPEVSSAWTWKRGVYDIEAHEPSGKVTRLIEGWMSISPEVTV